MADVFTLNDSLDSILENERVSRKIGYLFSPLYYEDIRPMFRKMKLKHMVRFVKTPWGRPFPAEGFIRCANFLVQRREAGEKISIPIWRGLPEDQMQKLEKVVLVPFVKSDRKKAPCVVICPGGAYNRVAFHNEGIPVAEKLCDMGYQAFILNYRVHPDVYPEPLQDVCRAIRFVRKNSEKLGVDPGNITLMGFSAGGHLAALAGALYDSVTDETHRYDDVSPRPDKLCLCYPVISFLEYCHEGSVENFLKEGSSQEDRKTVSADLAVTENFPKTYIWTCMDDATVPYQNSDLMADALKAKGVPHKFHMFDQGGHGIGLGEGTSAGDWLGEAMTYLK